MARTSEYLIPSEILWVQLGSNGDLVLYEQASAPGTIAGAGQLYVKTADGDLYFKDSSGVETNILTSASGAPINGTYITVTANGSLTDERVLTGTADQVILTDNGANSTMVLSLPQSIATTSTPTFGGLTLTTFSGAVQATAGVLSAGTLPVASGGTGATSFTAGSVIFSNGTIFTQDNTNFFWNDTDNRLGLGTNNPFYRLHIEAGNLFMSDSAENAIIMRRTGTFSGGDNPIFQFGRIVDAGGGVTKLRFLFSDDNTSEQAIFEMDGNGALSSTRPTTGTHFTGFVTGDAQPFFQLNSNLDGGAMGLALGAGGSTALDTAFVRTAANTITYKTTSSFTSRFSFNSEGIVFTSGQAIMSGTTNGDTLLFQAYDTNTGPGYVTFATLTSGTTPTFDLSTSTTIGGNAFYYVGGTDVAVADGGTGLSSISALSVWVANSANTITEVTPGAGNSIRINAGGTAWEAFTPSAGAAAQITVADEATDTTCFPVFVTAATGDLGPKSNANLTFNSNTGSLGATNFTGTFAGNTITTGTGTLTLGAGSTLITSATNSITLTSTGATNVTLPTTGTLATLAGAETLSSKTLTAPKFANAGFIADANGNELIIFTTTASAVNEITFANGATGVNPLFTASGETNVGIDFQAKGTGTYRLLGTADQAAELRLYEDTSDGTNYTAFKVGTQAGDITYTLPTDDGDAGEFLQTNGSGVLTWAAAGGGGNMVVFMSAGAGVPGNNCTLSWADQNVIASFTDNVDGFWVGQIQVPSGATSISEILVFYIRQSTGDLYLNFDTGHVDTQSNGTTIQNDTSDTDATYAGGAADDTFGIITVPSGAYNGLTSIEADDIIGLRINRTGSSGSDTYASAWRVIGAQVTFA